LRACSPRRTAGPSARRVFAPRGARWCREVRPANTRRRRAPACPDRSWQLARKRRSRRRARRAPAAAPIHETSNAWTFLLVESLNFTMCLVSLGGLGRHLRAPLAAAHARDLHRLEQTGFAKR